MWKAIVGKAHRVLYYLGKTPPDSGEVAAELDRMEKANGAGIAAGAQRCDCLVTAGNKQVGCYSNVLVAACHLIGDSKPGLNGTPLPVGGCKNLGK